MLRGLKIMQKKIIFPALKILGIRNLLKNLKQVRFYLIKINKNFSLHLIFLELLGSSLFFKSIDLSEYEKKVSANLIENTNQARELFNYTHSWLKRAKVFYTLQDHPMEYVNAVLDLSELYRYLAFYEEDIER